MATYNKFQQFVEDMAHGVHNLSSNQLVVALTNTAPTAGMEVLSEITEISYTNCSSRNITTTSSAQASGTYKLTLTDLTLTSSTGNVGPFRYAVIYNDTPTSPANPLIAWCDYGSSITLDGTVGETLLLDFDGTDGLFSLT
jgi:hypothetical protein